MSLQPFDQLRTQLKVGLSLGAGRARKLALRRLLHGAGALIIRWVAAAACSCMASRGPPVGTIPRNGPASLRTVRPYVPGRMGLPQVVLH